MLVIRTRVRGSRGLSYVGHRDKGQRVSGTRLRMSENKSVSKCVDKFKRPCLQGRFFTADNTGDICKMALGWSFYALSRSLKHQSNLN